MRILNIPWRIKQAYLNITFYLRHGFKRSDTWSLDVTLARWIIPRLQYFRESHSGYPEGVTPEEWDEKLGVMLRAFELCAAHFEAFPNSKEDMIREQGEVRVGLALFAEYFQALWD